MSELVLDCSVTAAWLFEDEVSPYAEAVLDGLATDLKALAPFIWPLEVINVLLVGERRGRINEAQSTAFWETLRLMPIAVDDRAPMMASDAIMALGRAHDLSAYDAAYLELAIRTVAPIATLDDRLARAANASGTGAWQP